MRGIRGLAAALGALALSACAGGHEARAANWLEQNFYLFGPRYDGALPPCEAGLNWISVRFNQKEQIYWNSNLHVVDFQEVKEIAFRPWAANVIPRRFCTAKALVSDGVWRPVHYSIGEDTGFVGHTWGVEFCVVGLDRNWAYNPRCKMARP